MNLYEVIKKNQFQGFSSNLVRKFAYAILQCLKLLYRERIIHCDLKPVRKSIWFVFFYSISYKTDNNEWQPFVTTEIEKIFYDKYCILLFCMTETVYIRKTY